MVNRHGAILCIHVVEYYDEWCDCAVGLIVSGWLYVAASW